MFANPATRSASSNSSTPHHRTLNASNSLKNRPEQEIEIRNWLSQLGAHSVPSYGRDPDHTSPSLVATPFPSHRFDAPDCREPGHGVSGEYSSS